MEEKKVHLKGVALPVNESNYKRTHPSQYETLQAIKTMVEHITAGKVKVHYSFPSVEIDPRTGSLVSGIDK